MKIKNLLAQVENICVQMKLFHYSKVLIYSALYLILAMDSPASDQESTPKQTKPKNTWCPILTDEPIEPEFTVIYKGESVGLCCEKCKRKFSKNPDKYLKNLPQFNKSETQGQTDTNLRPKEAAPQAEQQNNLSLEAGETSFVPVNGKGNQDGNSTKPPNKKNNPPKVETSWRQVLIYAGKFHPLVIHFPIALTITAALSEVVFMKTKNIILSNVARVNLMLACISAILATVLGWVNGEFIRVSADMESVLFRHRWFGISSTICLICAIFFSESARRLNSLKLNLGYRASLFIAALLIAVTGHFGGTLVFGSDYFNW